jgi:DNA polymerase III sliding clamp (beta) subunit (PCNA family)
MTLSHPQLRLLISLLNALTTKSGKTSLACLGHVFFTPTTGHTIISATDLDLQLDWPVPLHGSDSPLSQQTSSPIDWFLKMAAAVRPGGHLELRHTGQHLCALPSTSPSARSPEPFLPIQDAPAFTTTDFTHGGWLSHPTLEKAVAAMPFISTDETRHVLQGILITTTGHLVATDGRKLAHAPTRGTQLPRDIILPTRMIKAFEALANGTVTASGINHEPEHRRMQCWLSSSENVAQQLLAYHSGCYLRARLIEGSFPNWQQVLPQSFTTLIDISPEFLAILKVTLSRASNKKLTQVTFDLQPNGSVTASIHESGGSSRTELIDPCAAGTHSISANQPLFTCCWNAPYLLACLQFSGLRLYAIDSISPFRSGDPAAAQTVLMPMRVTV